MNLIERIVSLYAPLQCVACGLEGAALCSICTNNLVRSAECCYRCQQPSRLGRTCPACRQAGSQLISANAVTDYRATAKDLIWQLKFNRVQAAATPMAKVMAQHYGRYISDDTLIVPLPTAAKRVRSRGYDQAVLLARALARQNGRRIHPLLRRLGAGEQIGASRLQRQQQLAGVFRVRHLERIQGARILLVDDVLTTGATIESAAACLRQAGAKTVGALVFARA